MIYRKFLCGRIKDEGIMRERKKEREREPGWGERGEEKEE